MIFCYADKLTVEFSADVEQILIDLMKSYDYKIESGGILVGTMKSNSYLVITDVTFPQSKDRQNPFRFFRSKLGHQKLMDQLWKESGYKKMYMGEWHTHREPYPSPSGVDITGWKQIARKRQNAPWMLFLILGQQNFRLWTIVQGMLKELIPNGQ